MQQEHLKLRATDMANELPRLEAEPKEVSRFWKGIWLSLGWGLVLYQALVAAITLRDMYDKVYNGSQHLTFISGVGMTLILLLGMYTWLRKINGD